jgi:hypothetical protein
MNLAFDIVVLWWLSTALHAWIAYRIFRGDLGAQFQKFGLFLAISATASVTLAMVRGFFPNPNAYGYTFVVWTYASSIFEFFVIREITSKALERFPAIRAASRVTLNILWLALIALGSAWFYYLNNLPTQKKMSLLKPALRYQQSVDLGFTLFIFLFLAFLAWMPVPLSRNLLTHSFLTGAFFLIVTLSRFIHEFGTRYATDLVAMVGTILVLAIWNFRIQKQEDNQLNTPRGPVNAEEAKVLISRLEELNEALSRSGPRVFR